MEYKPGDRVIIIKDNPNIGICKDDKTNPFIIGKKFILRSIFYKDSIRNFTGWHLHGTDWWIDDGSFKLAGPLTESDYLDNIQRNIADDL